MALSCYSNFEELEGHLNSEMSIFAQPQMELVPPELLGIFDSNFSFSDHSYVDPFWESHEFFYSSNCHSLLPYVSSPPENSYSLVPEIFSYSSHDEYETYTFPYLKRQKVLYEESFNSEIIMPGLCNDFVVPNPSLFQEPSPEIFGPFPHFASNPPAYSSKAIEAPKKPGGGGSLSSQSIAARQRRRKITEKTQELGKLIPGGQKMNTAEMFQAAFNYIKFLQAQVEILEAMASIHQENGDSFDIDNQEMELLLGSSLIQEKLYSAEKCLAPKQLVESHANHPKLKLDIDHSSLDVKKLL